MNRRLCFTCLLSWWVGVPLWAQGSLQPLEQRWHWSLARELEERGVTQALAQKGIAPQELKARASFIMRSWYQELPAGGKWKAEGVRRLENVVLLDPDLQRLRFGWWTVQDYEAGVVSARLKIWRGPELKYTFAFRYPLGKASRDMERFLAEGRKLRDQGKLADKIDSHWITVEVFDRKLHLPYGDWVRGELPEEERRWLSEVVDEDLKEALTLLQALSRGTGELVGVCQLVLNPLLQIRDEPCKLPHRPFSLVRGGGKADCDFDAWFGESCSLPQQLDSTLRKQPQIAPPPSP